MAYIDELFNLTGKKVVITGSAGFYAVRWLWVYIVLVAPLPYWI